MQKMLFTATITLATAFTGFAAVATAAETAPVNARTVGTIESRFGKLMELENKHDIKGMNAMFWQSPSALLVAKSAIPSEGIWAGFWGNYAIDRARHEIAASGPVVLTPDLSRLKVVGLTHDIAESYAPMQITVPNAGQDGTPKPFLMIITWKKIAKDWKAASEIIVPVPPAAASQATSK